MRSGTYRRLHSQAVFRRFSTIQNHLTCVVSLWNPARRCAGWFGKPAAAIIDSQSVKTTDKGYDAGRKTKDRKRHMAIGTEGSPIVLQVHKDRGGARMSPDCLPTTATRIPGCVTVRAEADQGVHGSLPAPGGGADVCLDGPLPAFGEGLRAHARELAGMGESVSVSNRDERGRTRTECLKTIRILFCHS